MEKNRPNNNNEEKKKRRRNEKRRKSFISRMGKKCEAKMKDRERFFLYFILSSLLFLRTFDIEWCGKNVAYIKNMRGGEMGEKGTKVTAEFRSSSTCDYLNTEVNILIYINTQHSQRERESVVCDIDNDMLCTRKIEQCVQHVAPDCVVLHVFVLERICIVCSMVTASTHTQSSTIFGPTSIFFIRPFFFFLI